MIIRRKNDLFHQFCLFFYQNYNFQTQFDFKIRQLFLIFYYTIFIIQFLYPTEVMKVGPIPKTTSCIIIDSDDDDLTEPAGRPNQLPRSNILPAGVCIKLAPVE